MVPGEQERPVECSLGKELNRNIKSARSIWLLGFGKCKRLSHAGTCLCDFPVLRVDDVSCLMSRSAEPRLSINVLERVRERKSMERKLLNAWSEQEQEAKENCVPFFRNRALYLLRQRLGNKPPQFRLVVERWICKLRIRNIRAVEQELEQRCEDLELIGLS